MPRCLSRDRNSLRLPVSQARATRHQRGQSFSKSLITATGVTVLPTGYAKNAGGKARREDCVDRYRLAEILQQPVR